MDARKKQNVGYLGKHNIAMKSTIDVKIITPGSAIQPGHLDRWTAFPGILVEDVETFSGYPLYIFIFYSFQNIYRTEPEIPSTSSTRVKQKKSQSLVSAAFKQLSPSES